VLLVFLSWTNKRIINDPFAAIIMPLDPLSIYVAALAIYTLLDRPLLELNSVPVAFYNGHLVRR